MSTLFVNNLNTASGTTITVPTGKQLIGTDVGSVGGAGNVVQVVTTSFTTEYTRSGSTEADITGFAVTITPKYNTSKIMIIVSLTMGSGTTSGHHFRIKRTISGGSPTGVGVGSGSGSSLTFAGDGANGDTNRAHSISYHAHDTPNTTTATTYQMTHQEFGSQTLHMNTNTSKGGQAFDDNFASHITAMEIKV